MKKRLRQKRGATLVELLITFALFSLFMSAAAAVITPATQIFLKVKYLSYAQSVGDMVMEKVAGEVSSATDRVRIDNTPGQEGKAISFRDNTTNPVCITVKDKYLNIHYRVVRSADAKQEILFPAAEWFYDKNAYQGFHIQELLFTPLSDTAVEVKLTLRNEARDIDYTSTKAVEVYNIDGSAKVPQVEVGPVYFDDGDYYDKEDTATPNP